MSPAPGTKLGRYEIRSKIGEGGMGEVYLAQDTKLNRKVALKILPAELAANHDRMRRFVQEAKAASALNHPNIITIYEIDETESGHYLATEFIEGETLRERGRKAPLRLAESLDIATQIAGGLSAAHTAGIVHRDVKPENVMLRQDGIVKVLDFGLAKLTVQDSSEGIDAEAPTRTNVKTDPGVVMGTAIYMSPEQARGLPLDSRTDVFSLGIVLYEMVTGRLPFDGSNRNEIMASVLSDKEPQPLARYSSEAPGELSRIVLKALRKNRDERYQTIKDMLLDLKSLTQELEFAKKLERSEPPRAEAGASSNQETEVVSAAATGADGQRVAATSLSTVQASSAEYVVAGIRKHKLTFAVALAILLVLAASAGYGLLKYRASTGAGTKAINSIAVLPFQNKSTDADTDYLSDGLAESLIFRLSQLPGLKVSPTSSVMRYKGKDTDVTKIASELGVDAVMTGRLIKRGDNLNITVELVDTKNNKTLWGEQYERQMSDLLATQREIATTIAQKLQVKLSGNAERIAAKQYTSSNEAYQAYLKGRFFWNKRDSDNLRKAIENFKSASEMDPNFALAYVGLADSYGVAPYYDSTLSGTDTLLKAKSYAVRALEIDDSLSEAHASLANINTGLWNWNEAEKGYKRAIELNPNYASAHQWYGNHLFNFMRYDEAMVETKRAQELEPLSLIINLNLAELYMVKGDVSTSIELTQRTIDLDPNWYYARQDMAWLRLKQGRNADAISEALKSVEMSNRETFPLAVLGSIYAFSGKRAEAESILVELKTRFEHRNANGYDIARIYVGLGDRDQAFAWLEKDFQARVSTLPTWLATPPLDSLQDDPRFKDLARRIGTMR